MTKRILPVLAGLALVAGLLVALSSPPDVLQGDFVRILYIHVANAWLAFLAFGVTAAASIGWLVTRRAGYDRVAASSAEIGVLFTAVTLFTGMIWGKPIWGTFWDWGDARMASTALMFFVYLGYLALRRATPDRVARARRSAILGVIAVVQVPLVYFSVVLWRTLHQGLTIRPDSVQMEPEMLTALLVNVGAFSVLYLALLVARVRLARLEEATEVHEEAPAGSAVTAPRLETGP